MVGLALACGGASALNHVIDRDIDTHMSRTDSRPVAAQRVPPQRALEFGLTLSALSFVLLASTVNVLTALLALVGNLFYVLVYTGYLKRRTPQNIVIGGAAGAVPPLVGWAAVTGNLTLTAFVLFAIVFVWTPPHFWALALLIRRRLRGGRDPDAARRPRRVGDDPPDRSLQRADDRGHVAADRRRRGRMGIRRRGARPGRPLPVVRGAPAPPSDAASGAKCSSTTRCSTSRWSSSPWRRAI